MLAGFVFLFFFQRWGGGGSIMEVCLCAVCHGLLVCISGKSQKTRLFFLLALDC